jgi:BirA family biotin operon repressor/biotin-[acetyl-CoA-carboxylase] ligase
MDAPHNWRVEALWEKLSPLLPGISIEVLARTESTNTALLERVRSEARGENQSYGRRLHDMQPCLLVAEHQTQGRGRMGRAWLSTASGGSLTFSIGLVMDMADWSGLSLAVGCAVAEALEPLPKLPAGQEPRLQLKWPNDIWLDGNKLGGILIETVPAGAQRMAIIGIGLNISEQAAPQDSAASQFSTGFATLNQFMAGDEAPTAPAVLATIAPVLAQALHDFPQTGFAPWLGAYSRRDLTLNRAVSAGALEGISRGVDANGALQVETAPGIVSPVSGGEVSVRLAASSSAVAPKG